MNIKELCLKKKTYLCNLLLLFSYLFKRFETIKEFGIHR